MCSLKIPNAVNWLCADCVTGDGVHPGGSGSGAHPHPAPHLLLVQKQEVSVWVESGPTRGSAHAGQVMGHLFGVLNSE